MVWAGLRISKGAAVKPEVKKAGSEGVGLQGVVEEVGEILGRVVVVEKSADLDDGVLSSVLLRGVNEGIQNVVVGLVELAGGANLRHLKT